MSSVETYNSPYDTDPYNPNATPSGTAQALPSDLGVPTLHMAWSWIPEFDLVGVPPAGGGSAGSIMDVADDVTIDLGSLRAAEDSMLMSSMNIVTNYQFLSGQFEAVKTWVYGQEATTTGVETGGYEQGATYQTVADPIQPQAIAFANGDGTAADPGMNAVQEYTLQCIANVMGMVGELIAAMNAAGTAYAQADLWSMLPAAT
jgi:hypothetical protein